MQRTAEKDVYFRQRKEYKAAAHKVMKKHYFLLFFLGLAMMLFGTEYTFTNIGLGRIESLPQLLSDEKQAEKAEEEKPEAENNDDDEDPGNMFSVGDVYNDIVRGLLSRGIRRAAQIKARIMNEGAGSSKALGRTAGVLATLVNNASSGTFFAMMGNLLLRITQSEKAVGIVFAVTGMLWTILTFVFIRNVFSVIIRRVFLLARIYEKITFGDALHILFVRRWFKSCMTLLLADVFHLLWSFTIAGLFIKHYSYMAVPYIAAENPDVGAREAITLSRKMMDGHKMEAFKYDLSMIGWFLLGLCTLSIGDIFYGWSFRLCAVNELYVRIREEAIEEGLEGTELLNDPYLFKKADKILLYEIYFDVVDEITLLHENKVVLSRARRRASEWFGVWLGSLKDKKKHDEQEGLKYAISQYRLSMDGQAYPRWLNPLVTTKQIKRIRAFSPLRCYSIWTLFLMFILFSIIGWCWEVALHYMQTGELVNRGTLHGPWLPIYGGGGVIVLLICSRFRKNPVKEFLLSMVLCGALEYFAAWYLETRYHMRWWSYDGYFLNLHGRICAEGLLAFGVGCCIMVYVIAPFFDYLLSFIKPKILVVICVCVGIIFGADVIYSAGNPNISEGAVESGPSAAVQGAAGT